MSDCGMDFPQLSVLISWFLEQVMGNSERKVKVGKRILGSLIKIRELELCSAGRKAFVYSCSKPSSDFSILIMPLKCRQSTLG